VVQIQVREQYNSNGIATQQIIVPWITPTTHDEAKGSITPDVHASQWRSVPHVDRRAARAAPHVDGFTSDALSYICCAAMRCDAHRTYTAMRGPLIQCEIHLCVTGVRTSCLAASAAVLSVR